MSKLSILEFPDPRLRTIATPVEVFDAELQQLVDDMAETMYAAEGIGLAATQVNSHQRLLVMDVSEARDNLQVFINPEIVAKDGEQVYQEGCLSVPGIYADVTRAEQIQVQAQDSQGSQFECAMQGLAAVCLQHEMDHLQGKLFVDYLSPLKRALVKKKLAKLKRA